MAVVAEEDCRIKAFVVKDNLKEVVELEQKLKQGVKVISISLSPLQITSRHEFKFLVAVACFDHSKACFYTLVSQKGKL